MKNTPKSAYTITLLIAILISNFSFAQMKMENKITLSDSSAALLRADMRVLWGDHVTWTRNVIFCIADSLPGSKQAVNRLMQNQVDIGNAIKPFYGDDAGNKLTSLLTTHITIAAEVVKTAKAGNIAELAEVNKRWYANADEISEFLSKVNPNWLIADMKSMMYDHLRLTTDEAAQRIKKNYDADVLVYDKVHLEILKMSDMLAYGIIKQFSEKAKTTSTKISSN